MVLLKKIWISISLKIIVLTLGIIYPFMAGDFDSLAMPLSTIIQGIGIIGIILFPIGLTWLFIPERNKLFAVITIYIIGLMIIVITFFAYLISGVLFSMTIFLILTPLFLRLRNKVAKPLEGISLSYIPIYFIVLPLSILIIQLLIAKPVTDWCRDRTISHAKDYIRDIEMFFQKNGYYPKTLQAMYKDYYPNTVGVEKYYYIPFGNSYNLCFEQPRFFLDIVGTKEWVVYNPKDEHKVFSHTSWFLLLSPAESEIRQGWYASRATNQKHWKSFYFD